MNELGSAEPLDSMPKMIAWRCR